MDRRKAMQQIEEDAVKNGGVLSKAGIALSASLPYPDVKKALAKARLRISQEIAVGA